MCGVAGVIVFQETGFTVTEAYLASIRDAMAHRGPDGTGSWISADGRVGLAHRRLAIIDLSPAAAQPMSIQPEGLHIVFNGEIYNHAEIRRELVALGHSVWITDHSDTEVIIRAFAQWGIECIERFRGMFVFALWDDRTKELWIVRDRIGIKPLYYSSHDGRLVFASEIKALLEDPQQSREVDEEALYHFLSFLTTPAPMTLFQGIRKLPAGTWMRVALDGTVEERRYWDVWDHTEPLTTASDEEIAERVLDSLRTSVALRTVSDVPVGVFLSGGIDSSANVALFSQTASVVRSFTIGYVGDHPSSPNETGFARRMAETVRSEHHELLLTQEDVVRFLPEMVRLQDEPIADPVCAPLYYVSKLARDHGVTVCQAGEGADELFCGYRQWRAKVRLQAANDLPVPQSLKRAGMWAMRRSGREATWPYEWLRRGTENLPVFWGGAEAFTETQKHRLLSPRLRKKFKALSSWSAIEPIHERFIESAWDTSALSWMSYLDLRIRLPELLLMRLDKMTMGVSLEGRVPFLDHKFVELAMSIPPTVKLRHGELKFILKKAVRGLIPDEMIDRPKQGFGVPVTEWVLGRLGEFAAAEIRSLCDGTDLFDRDAVEAMITARSPRLWFLLNFALWWKEFIGGQRPRADLAAAAAVGEAGSA